MRQDIVNGQGFILRKNMINSLHPEIQSQLTVGVFITKQYWKELIIASRKIENNKKTTLFY